MKHKKRIYRRYKTKKRGGQRYWVSRKPRRRNYGIGVWYGPKLAKLGKTGITLDDVIKAIRSDPRLDKQTKELGGIVIERYPTPKQFGKKARSEAFLSILKDPKEKPWIILQALPAKGETVEQHRAKISEEIRHELKHLQQLKEGRLKRPKRGRLVDEPKLEEEALKSMK